MYGISTFVRQMANFEIRHLHIYFSVHTFNMYFFASKSSLDIIADSSDIRYESHIVSSPKSWVVQSAPREISLVLLPPRKYLNTPRISIWYFKIKNALH